MKKTKSKELWAKIPSSEEIADLKVKEIIELDGKRVEVVSIVPGVNDLLICYKPVKAKKKS